ncbi:Ribonuclease H-like superfamily [Sesbania bispinosa]|nr:Ribonuclease H-like superfamily [Sesbania bispinosa]
MRLPELKFSGQIMYSRTFDDVQSAITRLLKFLEEKKREMVQIAIGLDVEWRPTFQKVGVGIGEDVAKVFRDYNISIKGVEDLSFHANQKLGRGPHQWGLGSLTEKVLSKQLRKPKKIRMGNWESFLLSRGQLQYAATDAYASWYLYQAIKNLPEGQEVPDSSGQVDGVPQQ